MLTRAFERKKERFRGNMKVRTLSVVSTILILILAGCQGQNRGSGNLSSSSSSNTTSSLPSATYFTTPQVMNASTTISTLTWNLGTQIQGASPLPGGGSMSITVQEVTSSSGELDYQFGTPTVTGGAQTAILVQNVGFMINGVNLPLATVLIGVNRMIPAGASRVLSTTTQIVPVTAFSASDTLQLTFGNLAPTVFNPPTYTQLKSATGVFGANCTSCHSGATPPAGLDLTNYADVVDKSYSGYYPAVAFDPTDSLLIMVLNGTNGMPLMPKGAVQPLPAATIQSVSDWINDGALNN